MPLTLTQASLCPAGVISYCAVSYVRCEHTFPSWEPAGSTQDIRFAQLCFSGRLPFLPPPSPNPAWFQWTSARSCPTTEVMPFFSGKHLVHLECHQEQINVSCTSEKNPSLLRVLFMRISYKGNTMILLLP